MSDRGNDKLSNHLIWIDLEMTGLNPEKEVILEIATIIADDSLEIVAEGPNISINYPEESKAKEKRPLSLE